MSEHPIPTGVSFDTLRDVVAGWWRAGAASEAVHTSAVAEETGVSSAGRQNAFLEAIDVLEADGQTHRLTEAGGALAQALADGETERARALLYERLDRWPPTERIRGVVRANPLPEDDLVPVVAAIAGRGADDGNVRTGVRALLDALAWSGHLDVDDDGRYRVAASAADDENAGATADEIEGGRAGETPASDGIGALLGALDGADVGVAGGGARERSAERAGANSSPMPGEDALALSLDLTVDTNPEDMEALVRAIRRGLMAETDDDEER